MTNLPSAPTDVIRVLLDCRMSSWTGVGRYSVGLARALARRDDVEVVLAVAAGDTSPVPDAATLVAQRHPFSLAGARELGRIVRAAAPDITHCLHFPTPSPAPHPLVVTMHDLAPLLVAGIMPSPLKRAVYRTLNARAVRVADRLVTDSAFSLTQIERVFPRAAGRITSIPLAADDFSGGPHEPLAPPLAGLATSPYLLSMGSTRPHKNLPTLLRAFEHLAPSHPGLRLLLVGADAPGYVAEHLPGAPDSVRERVVFTGHVADGELRTLMAGAAAFAFPSRFEGFGLPPLEAMALGAPVVVARAASLPEVVGDAALLVEPGDPDALAAALERILGDAALLDRLVSAGLARATEFTWAATAEATVAVYREVMGS